MPGESVPQGLWVPPRIATLFVAASDALDRSRAQCDYLCSGASDQVQINQALNALPAGVQGRVVLSEGTFTIDAPIDIPGNNITLRGQGESTFIDGDGLATNEHGIVISGVTSCAIKRLRIQTQDGGGKTCHCIFIEDGSNGAHIEEIVIDDSDSDGIHIEGTAMYDISIHDVTINDADGYGIFTDMDAGNSILRCHVSHCLIIGTGSAGIYHGATGAGALYCEWNNNIVAAAGGHGIELHEASYSDSSNNILILSTGGNGMYLSACTHCNLEGNQCYSNLGYGIEIDDSTENLIAGNVCTLNDTGDSGLNNGINLDAGATNNQVTANICDLNHGRGINNAGAYNGITGNQCNENDRDGIYSNGAQCQINNNHVYDNNQDAKYGAASATLLNSLVDATLNQFVADDVGSTVWNTTDNTYATVNAFVDVSTVTLSADIFTVGENYIMYKSRHGIVIGGGGNYCQVNNNYCDSPGDSQEDGIHLEAGAHYVQIVGNYCLNGMGDGIELAGNNDYCLIKDNYCYDNDDYGIAISADTCEKNIVEGNSLKDNDAGQLNDVGTCTTVGESNKEITPPEVKRYVYMKNTSVAQRVAGDVVIFKSAVPAGDEFTTTTTLGDDHVLGIVAETIAVDAYGYVLVAGKTTVLKGSNDNGNIAVGDFLCASDTAVVAVKAGALDTAFAIALEALAAVGPEPLDALLINPMTF